jgi:ABC-type dipeptide/oligopeptide/nickel transport system permease component
MQSILRGNGSISIEISIAAAIIGLAIAIRVNIVVAQLRCTWMDLCIRIVAVLCLYGCVLAISIRCA